MSETTQNERSIVFKPIKLLKLILSTLYSAVSTVVQYTLLVILLAVPWFIAKVLSFIAFFLVSGVLSMAAHQSYAKKNLKNIGLILFGLLLCFTGIAIVLLTIRYIYQWYSGDDTE